MTGGAADRRADGLCSSSSFPQEKRGTSLPVLGELGTQASRGTELLEPRRKASGVTADSFFVLNECHHCANYSERNRGCFGSVSISFHHLMLSGISSPQSLSRGSRSAQRARPAPRSGGGASPAAPPGRPRVPSYRSGPGVQRPCRKQHGTSRPLDAPRWQRGRTLRPGPPLGPSPTSPRAGQTPGSGGWGDAGVAAGHPHCGLATLKG